MEHSKLLISYFVQHESNHSNRIATDKLPGNILKTVYIVHLGKLIALGGAVPTITKMANVFLKPQ